jgi:hypothetical protein
VPSQPRQSPSGLQRRFTTRARNTDPNLDVATCTSDGEIEPTIIPVTIAYHGLFKDAPHAIPSTTQQAPW